MKDCKGNPIQAGDRVLLHGTVQRVRGNVEVAIDGGAPAWVLADKLHVVSHEASDCHEPIIGDHHDPAQRMWGLDEQNKPLYPG